MTLTVPAGAKPGAMASSEGHGHGGQDELAVLQLGHRRTGALGGERALAADEDAKNLEIILDASGSMKALMASAAMGHGARHAAGRAGETARRLQRGPAHLRPSRAIELAEDLHRQRAGHAHREARPAAIMNRHGPTSRRRDAARLLGAPVAVGSEATRRRHSRPHHRRRRELQGRSVKAAAELKASGLDIRLSLVGSGHRPVVQKDLSGFAQAGGGRFYAAQSGQALTDALLIAAIERFPYACSTWPASRSRLARPEVLRTSWRRATTRSSSRPAGRISSRRAYTSRSASRRC